MCPRQVVSRDGYPEEMSDHERESDTSTPGRLLGTSGLAVGVTPGPRSFTPQAPQLLFDCSRHLTLALAHALSGWWSRGDPVQAGFRADRSTPGSQYSPEERFRIVVLRRTYGMSLREAAELFLVDPQTIARWEREALAEPDAETIGTLVRAEPPLRGYDDVVKRLVQMLDSFQIGGSAAIAQWLARAGVRIGRETVRRYRKAPRPPRPIDGTAGNPRVLVAKRGNHVWTADLTEIRGFLGLVTYKLVVVLDLYSRFPLACGIFTREPTAEEVVDVLDRAIRGHGSPGHFVSDQGSQFTAAVFREKLTALAIGQRFGAIGHYGSIAVIERFWRTLKELLGVKLWPPLSKAHLEAKVELALTYYSHLRPHQGLGGATPAEIYRGESPAAGSAVPPPRKTREPTAGEEALPIEVVFLDRERRMPALIPARDAA